MSLQVQDVTWHGSPLNLCWLGNKFGMLVLATAATKILTPAQKFLRASYKGLVWMFSINALDCNWFFARSQSLQKTTIGCSRRLLDQPNRGVHPWLFGHSCGHCCCRLQNCEAKDQWTHLPSFRQAISEYAYRCYCLICQDNSTSKWYSWLKAVFWGILDRL